MSIFRRRRSGVGFVLLALTASLIVGCGRARSPMNAQPGEELLVEPRPVAASNADPQVLRPKGGTVDLQIDGTVAAGREEVVRWVETGVRAVTTYFGRFPVRHARVEVRVEREGHDIGGVTYDGKLIQMRLGSSITPADLHDDWTMTHEMFHLAFPDMGDRGKWLNEGLSTYLEPVARARLGILSKEEYWKELAEGLPKGQPEPGDRGLDVTHTWGRTYWGGAMFWFVADATIREQTQNRKSLDDAIRAILEAGGDGSADWTFERVSKVGDRATGTHVLRDLYAEMATKPVEVDLDSWWKRLGVEIRRGRVKFDDTTPIHAIRDAMIGEATPSAARG